MSEVKWTDKWLVWRFGTNVKCKNEWSKVHIRLASKRECNVNMYMSKRDKHSFEAAARVAKYIKYIKRLYFLIFHYLPVNKKIEKNLYFFFIFYTLKMEIGSKSCNVRAIPRIMSVSWYESWISILLPAARAHSRQIEINMAARSMK